jgi:hypothetical protein
MLYSLTYLIGGIIGLIVTFIVLVIPTGMILKRLGYSEWWALVMFIPGGALIGLWILAFADWPGPVASGGKKK